MVAGQLATTGRALTAAEERAALLLAEDDEPDTAIAARCTISEKTLNNWKKRPEFAARIAEHREAFRQRVFRTGFADKAKRVRALNAVAGAVFAQLQQAEYQTILKVTDDGEHIYGFDRDRLRVFLDYLGEIAEEMGDRQAKGATAAVVVKVYTDARMDNPLEADWHDAPAPRSSADR